MRRLIMALVLLLSMVILVACTTPKPIILKDTKQIKETKK